MFFPPPSFPSPFLLCEEFSRGSVPGFAFELPWFSPPLKCARRKFSFLFLFPHYSNSLLSFFFLSSGSVGPGVVPFPSRVMAFIGILRFFFFLSESSSISLLPGCQAVFYFQMFRSELLFLSECIAISFSLPSLKNGPLVLVGTILHSADFIPLEFADPSFILLCWRS